MKCTCAISGIPFEVPHLTGYNSQAIHPALFLPLDRIAKLSHAANYGSTDLSHDEIHLLTLAFIYQLQQRHGNNSLINLEGSVKPPSIANLFNLSKVSTVATLSKIMEFLPTLDYASKLLNNTHNLPRLVLRNLPELPLTYTGILSSISEYLKELRLALQDNSNRIRQASAVASQLTSLPRGDGRAKKLQDIQLSRLSTSNEETKRRAVKSFLIKFGNLPEFIITSPITNRQTRCATYWLSLLELSDNELAMIPSKDIQEFREHLVDQDVQSLLAGRLIIEQIDSLLARKNNVLDLSFALLDMISDHGATFKVLDGDSTSTSEDQQDNTRASEGGPRLPRSAASENVTTVNNVANTTARAPAGLAPKSNLLAKLRALSKLSTK